MLIFSKYLREYTIGEYHVFYSMISDYIILVHHASLSFIEDGKLTPTLLKNNHPNLYNEFVLRSMVVDESVSELKQLVDKWKNEDNNPTEAKITVLPTLQCNLRCWYCYENHSGKTRMDSNIIERITKHIDKTYAIPSIRKLTLDFFGGEPLLYFSTCIYPLIEEARVLSKLHNKRLGISFTTNGVLLTKEICKFLKKENNPVSLQITLDGDKEHHDAIRHLSNGKGTFDIICNNILIAVAHGIYVSVRFNYTKDNHKSFTNILSVFENLHSEQKRFIDFSFHKVWQEPASEQVESHIQSTKDQYIDHNFETNVSVLLGDTSRCYADTSHDIVVNYNGQIYKCTAREFNEQNSDGTLCSDGSVLWNSHNKLRDKLRYGTEFCYTCQIFPICHGGCSQNKIEREDLNQCIFEYTEQDKERIVKARVETLLRHRIHSIIST